MLQEVSIPDSSVGDLMIIKDHISFSIVNPLLGKNIAALGPRFPDMSEPYSKALVSKAHASGLNAWTFPAGKVFTTALQVQLLRPGQSTR
jgi:purine nucleoside phosphorylase